MTVSLASLDDLVAEIGNGCRLALPPDYSGCAMSAVARLVERGPRDLHLIGVPTGGLQFDWLIGAGAVSTVEVAAMTLGEFGVPPRFAEAFRSTSIKTIDGTCPAIQAGLQAAEKGIPFMPLRGIIGSDLLNHRSDWKVVDNPMAAAGDPIVLISAITPDVTLFHASACDRNGNVWIGVRRELMLMAHASRKVLVTVEDVVDTDFLADELRAPGTIPALYVDRIAVAHRGGDPVGLAGRYEPQSDVISSYARAARTTEGFAAWMQDALGITIEADSVRRREPVPSSATP
ncbi:MAG: CoA transferase subunit A [Hyphomicrobiaceae bacterium]